ncbi:MAG: transposase, partial [Planctomycetales bacterium]|nr:transposase [Planctomycetales bacterium]
MGILQEGMILKLEDQEIYRVLWSRSAEQAVWLFAINNERALPNVHGRTSLEDRLLAKTVLIVDSAAPTLRAPSELTAAEKLRLDKSLTAIADIAAKVPDIFFADKRAALVREVCDAHSISRPTVYLKLRRWWRGGCVPAALVPDFAKCGAPGEPRIDSTGTYKKVGRPRNLSSGLGFNLGARDRKNIELALSRRYLRNGSTRMESAYLWMLVRLYPDAVSVVKTKGRIDVKVTDKDAAPTRGQFDYHAQKFLDFESLLLRRKGRRQAERQLEKTLSDSREGVLGPGSRYQIDSTVVDVYLASRLNRNRVVGRPTLYIVIDVFSGAIVGFYIGLEPACWMGAVMALLSTLDDNESVCRDYGIPIPDGAWPMRGFPRVLLGDGGEVSRQRGEVLGMNFGVTIETARPYDGAAKGLVEKSFNVVQRPLGEYVPGYVEKDFQVRGSRDYRLDAMLTVEELKAYLLAEIVKFNLRPRRAHPEDVWFVPTGAALSPVELWKWGETTLRSEARHFSKRSAEPLLFVAAIGTVTRSGIRFRKGLYYISSELLTASWFNSAVEKKEKLKVAHDPRDVSRIYVFPPGDRSDPIIAELTRHSSR